VGGVAGTTGVVGVAFTGMPFGGVSETRGMIWVGGGTLIGAGVTGVGSAGS